MSLTIRSAVETDADAIIALWRACGLVARYNDPAADLRFARRGACSDVLVGSDDAGAVVASIMVGHDGHRGWLYYVAVHPASRGRGHGRGMVRAGEAWLREREVRKVQLLVRETNAEVVAFYARLGFEATPRVVMARWLEPPA